MHRSATGNHYLGGNGKEVFLRYHRGMDRISSHSHRPVGDLLREWRQRRRMSQMDLAGEANISTRHLSFVETGRSQASREMILLLAEQLEISLRERNTLLVAAGYAPVFPERTLADPALDAARKAVDMVLAGHEPYPALAIDRHWNLVAANKAVPLLLVGADPALMKPPVNVLRLSMHPSGLASRIANYRQWRSHLVARLQQQIEVTADPFLAELRREIRAYPVPKGTTSQGAVEGEVAGIVVPLQLVYGSEILSLFSTTTIFGTAVDVTVSELAIESFFPADTASAALLRQMTDGAR
jgi:transcriptional regulator with XRE-family HTH domain